MKKDIKLLLIYLLIFYCSASDAQFTSNIWCFGDSASIRFDNDQVLFSSVISRGSCASICDSSGNLLFYASSSPDALNAATIRAGKVYSYNHSLMQGGDTIICRAWYKELTIVPDPANVDLFYLFSAGVTSINGFFYSIIDISQNNGLGAVVQKNVQLQGSTFWANDGLAAVKHGNGRDWWVMVRDWSSSNDLFYFYLVAPTGVVLHHVQSIGDTLQPSFYRIEPSENGELIAVCSAGGLIEVFDFDRCTGLLSNEFLIEHEAVSPAFPWYWDCELSFNNSLLYVSSNYTQNDSNSYLFQYNLNDSNPSLTRDTLFSIKQPIVGGLLEMAPDSKMYWACNYDVPGMFPYPYPDTARNVYNENLSVINYPDSLGVACDFQPFSFYLGGKRTYYGLPNNPNYELGPDSGSVCDTITVGIENSATGAKHSALFVFYHHEWQTVFINAKGLTGKKYLLTVVDLYGHTIHKREGKLNGPYFTYDLHFPDVADGLYVVSLITDKEVLSRKFVRQ